MDMDSRKPTFDVLSEVSAEVNRQEAKWGEQNHPDGTSQEKFEWMANLAKMNCDHLHKEKKITWAAVLFEEFYEALAEGATNALRTELVQVAAVAVSWIKAIDRRERAVRQLSDS